MVIKIVQFSLLFLMLVSSGTSNAMAADTSQCSIADSAIQRASAIRGLASKGPVKCLIHDRDQVAKFLLEQIDTKIPPERLRGEEIVFKMLGAIPEDYQYRQGIVDMYLSQLGGYYDPAAKHYVMAAWMPGILQTTIAVHELTHALQDQYYDLEPFTDPLNFTSDQLLARSALVEGDATAVMMDYERGQAGQRPLVKEDDVSSFIMQSVLGAALSGGGKVPYSLQMQLLFPYSSGLRFVFTLLKQGGYPAIDKAFKVPPNSTEEILHPEKYLERHTDAMQQSDQIAVPKGWKNIYEDTLGEFVISTILGSNPEQRATAAQSAAGWAADRVAVFERSGGDPPLRALVWTSDWDTETDAEEFAAAYGAMLKTRKLNVTDQLLQFSTENSIADSKSKVVLARAGKRVTVQMLAPIDK